MAIQQVTSVSFRNKHNQVNFNGRKEKNETYGFQTGGYLKAIPLAALLSMSPFAVQAQESGKLGCNVDKSKTYVLTDKDKPIALIAAPIPQEVLDDIQGGYEFTYGNVMAYDSDGDESDCEKIVITLSGKKGIEKRIHLNRFVVEHAKDEESGEVNTSYRLHGLVQTIYSNSGKKTNSTRGPVLGEKAFEYFRSLLSPAITTEVKNTTATKDDGGVLLHYYLHNGL